MSDLICPSCKDPAETTNTKYGRRDDCSNCELWSWGGKPLSDRETHNARKAAHAAFDKLWKGGDMTRSDAYALLAPELGLTTRECHMATMDKATALRVPAAAGAITERTQGPPTCHCGHTKEQHDTKTKGCKHVASTQSRAQKQYGSKRKTYVVCPCKGFRT